LAKANPKKAKAKNPPRISNPVKKLVFYFFFLTFSFSLSYYILKMVFRKIFNRFLHKEELSLKHVFGLFSFIFVIWAVYRYFPGILPAWVEELILKPIIWLSPTFLVVKKIEKRKFSSLGITLNNLLISLFFGVGFGLIFTLEGFLVYTLKSRVPAFSLFKFSSSFLGIELLLLLATAISEEIVFRGYFFTRFWEIWKNEWLANFLSSLLFSFIHLPIAVFVLNYTFLMMSFYLFLIFIYGAGAALVFARSKNILSSILLHFFWSLPAVLFK